MLNNVIHRNWDVYTLHLFKQALLYLDEMKVQSNVMNLTSIVISVTAQHRDFFLNCAALLAYAKRCLNQNSKAHW